MHHATGLTSRLAKLVLVSVFCVLGTPLMASETVEFGSDESARYLTELKKLYLTNSDREALLAHSNGMLDTYALRAGYQVGQSNPQDFLYELSVSAPASCAFARKCVAAAAALPCAIAACRSLGSIPTCNISVLPKVRAVRSTAPSTVSRWWSSCATPKERKSWPRHCPS